MEFIFVALGIIGVIILVIMLHRGMDNLIEKSANKEIEKLVSIYPNLLGEEYSYFTNNHPYVWGEVSRDELSKLIKFSATGPRGVPYDPPIYSSKIDQENKKFYFVPHRTKFDFSKLMHYQEWLESQTEVVKNIAKYKNS